MFLIVVVAPAGGDDSGGEDGKRFLFLFSSTPEVVLRSHKISKCGGVGWSMVVSENPFFCLSSASLELFFFNLRVFQLIIPWKQTRFQTKNTNIEKLQCLQPCHIKALPYIPLIPSQ